MFKINNNELYIKCSTIDFKISFNKLVAIINIVTYIGLYDDVLEDVKLNMELDVGVYNLDDMVGKTYKGTAIVNDKNFKDVKITFLDINKEKFMIKIISDSIYIECPIDMKWFYGEYNKSLDENFEYISKYLSLDEINPLPFYEGDEVSGTLKFMIER